MRLAKQDRVLVQLDAEIVDNVDDDHISVSIDGHDFIVEREQIICEIIQVNSRVEDTFDGSTGTVTEILGDIAIVEWDDGGMNGEHILNLRLGD